MNKLLSGMQAGLIATGPMSIAMIALHRQLHESEKSPFPPASISNDIFKLDQLGVSENVQSLVSTVNHLAYGAIAGGIYAQSFRGVKTNTAAKGLIYGAGFWAVNYLALLPTLDVRASAYKMTLKRNLMMFSTHLVFGLCLSYTCEALEREGLQMLAGENKGTRAE